MERYQILKASRESLTNMGKKERAGKIESRNIGFRKPDLGYYYIITDAVETEPNYFNGIKENLPNKVKGRLVIKVKTSKTYDMVDTILNDVSKSPIVYDPWIVFDRDQVKDFDQIIIKAKKYGVNVGWSNPCIEILFLAYFGKSPNINDQKDCIREFENEYYRKTGKKYQKNNKEIYNDLTQNGDETSAVNELKRKYEDYVESGIKLPSKMIGVSMVYTLLEEIGDKVNNAQNSYDGKNLEHKT